MEMRGFKSFGPRKTVVTLDRGLTVITGPNGSGKSNILDGVRFVLGDLSARSMRASTMADLIYDRSSGVKGSRSARVAIQLDNSDRRIPVDTDVVGVSREVRTDGTSTYRLNGRRVPRSQLVDILSVAGLSPSGHNVIMQGTITRLADITPLERRTWIEDLIGIAEYDAKRAEAQVQLRQADINLRVASARIDEVQSRLESLERERNQALRYNFIQGEIRRLQAALTSHRISALQGEIEKLQTELHERAGEAEGLRERRDRLQLEREGVESERRRFDEEVADKGSVRLVAIQKTIGDMSSRIAGLRAEIEAETMSLKRLTRIRDERAEQFEALSRGIKGSLKALGGVKRERDRLRRALDEKKGLQSEVLSTLTDMRQSLEVNTGKLKELEEGLEGLRRDVVRLSTKLNERAARNRVVADNLKALEERRSNFESTLKNFQEHLKELRKLRGEETKSLTTVSETLQKSLSRKEALVRELDEAGKTFQTARSTLVEFKTQRGLADRVAAEERALQRVEELGEVGAISGVHGRLESLVNIRSRYRRAIEAAASGWLKAVVVDDMETALKCAESLKRMRIGRVKIIPLKEASARVRVVEPPNIDGVIGVASNFLRYSERYAPAVNFIFGDTVITSGEKSAYLAYRAGYRAVDVNGDLYDAGGGIEGGYYRAPLDISSILPSDEAIEGLDKSIKALDRMLERRSSDIRAIDDEVDRFSEDRLRRAHIIDTMEREVNTIEQSIKRARENIKTLNRRVRRLRRYLDRGTKADSTLRSEREATMQRLRELRSRRRALRKAMKPSVIAGYEQKHTELDSEINELQRRLVELESEVSFLESNLENTLNPEFERAKTDLRTLNRQISTLQKSITQAHSALDEAYEQISELEGSRESLSKALASVKDERKKFEDQLDRIDAQLKQLNSGYFSISDEAHHLELTLNTKRMGLGHLEDELHSLGYTEPLTVTPEEARDVRFELERLGSVNQLAIQQYVEQKDNYKQLSIRRNELEGERRAILQFMDEVERKKRAAFMDAYGQIDENFKSFFSRITGGGRGWLQLQNPEDPFSGGIDLFVQFPNKAARLVSGASGGEKSVAAVSFILAIQNLSPAPFYIFDEIGVHLDPYYAERLADLLKEQSKASQFVVITLRDVMIDRSERLFGVYSQNGISRIVSLKLAEAVA
ncbi:MAG: chromosome segregation protein SMC [Candidatus Bathyarchaeia archaeon]